MTTLKQLPIGKQVLFVFGTLCTIQGLTRAFLILSLRPIQRSSHEQLAYVTEEAGLVAATAQNIAPMLAVIFRRLFATDPIEIKLVVAPQCKRSRR